MPLLSIAICTYNPKDHVFQDCLNAILAANTNSVIHEVIIVDNNSKISISDRPYIREFISSVQNSRVVVERSQGLTPARLRAIQECSGDVIVFVDDDNIIDKDFLDNGLQVARQYPFIGSWSGQVELLFEKTPESWTRKYWGLLVHRQLLRDCWSNLPHLPESMPCGAGLFVRRLVAQHYLFLHQSGQRKFQLDRSASSLASAGDNDLAACACDIGLGVGLFLSVRLQHYIPVERTTKEYLVKLAQGIANSGILFRSLRGEFPPRFTAKNRLANVIRLALKSSIDRQFQMAVYRGEEEARQLLLKCRQADTLRHEETD